MHPADATPAVPANDWWLPATSAAERGTTAHRPDWADFVEQVLALAPQSAADAAGVLRTAPELGDEGRLLHPLWPFLVAAGARFDATAGGPDARVVLAGARDWLGGRLVRLAGRTLVGELRSARRADALRGENGRERFDAFVRGLAVRRELARLLHRHPVLARLLAECCLHTVAAAAELVDRLRADRPGIVAHLLEGDPGRLAAMRLGVGDAHAAGRTVALLDFADGQRLVYKPRPLGLHARWNELLDWFAGRRPDLAPRGVRVLPGDGYGWAEFVAARPCGSADEVSGFYRRLGAQLALLHAVDATDIHCENLVAGGDQPVVVDVETLFHPHWAPESDGGDDPAAQVLAASAHRTTVLPYPVFGEHGVLDISAIGAGKGAVHPDDLPAWADPGTDLMRLIRRRPPYPGGDNRPVLAGAPAEPAEHTGSLVSGFRAAYRVLAAHAAELTGGEGVLGRFAGEWTRLVMRPSQTYADWLAESTEPELLRDLAGRERAFAALADETGYRHLDALVAQELADLMSGDLPVFAARTDALDVRTAAGGTVRGLLDADGLSAARARISRMGPRDLHRQEWLIEATLATTRPAVGHTAGPPADEPVLGRPPDQQHLFAHAAGIGDELLARSCRGAGRANWLGLERLDGEYWSVQPAGAGLAEGYCGIALFLAELGRLSGISRYLDLADQAVRPLPKMVTLLAETPALAAAVGPGGFYGLGGICYATARLANLLENPALTAAVPGALAAVATARTSECADVADGTAGALLAVDAVFAETGLPEAADLARLLSERLARQRWPDARGFLWGRDGVVRSLGGRPPPQGGPSDDPGWCSGLAGTAVGGPATERYLALLSDRPPPRDLSLCHGELGVLEPLVLLREAGDPRAAALLRHRCARLLGSLDRYGVCCGTPGGVATPGLLTGLAGVGYGLLRLGFGNLIPSVLLLRPAARTEPGR